MESGFFTKKFSGADNILAGAALRQQREKRNITLERVSEATKIPEEYIDHLEEGKYDCLPAKVYIIGFLKSYAQFLKLNPHEIVRLYKKEVEFDQAKEHKRCSPAKATSSEKRVIITPKLIRNVLIIVGVFLFGTYLVYQISNFAKTPDLDILSPVDNFKTTETKIRFACETSPKASVTINGQEAFVDKDGSFDEEVSLEGGINTFTIAATNRSNKENVRILQVMREGGTVKNSSNKDSGTKARVELLVSVIDIPTWIYVESDNKTVYDGTMLPGTSQTFSAKDKVSLTSDKANKTQVSLMAKNWEFLAKQKR